MKNLKLTGLIFLAVLIIIASVHVFPDNDTSTVSFPSTDSVVFHGGLKTATVNGKNIPLDGEVLDVNSCVYVASDKLLSSLGYSLGWKDDIRAVVAIKEGVTSYIIVDSPILFKGPYKYASLNKTIIYQGVFYIPLDMFTYLTDSSVALDGEIKKIKFHNRDLLEDTYIGNDYRLSGSATPYGGVYVLGNRAMERVEISENDAIYYAGIVNKIAENLPESVNVYNIVVPSSSEFYGSENVYTDQTAGIRKIYQNLSDRVIPINAVRSLYEHANESIYFRTDHHWTQRGAYYAYKEFMDIKGESVPPLSAFPLKTGKYTGSFANFAKGTGGERIIRANPDTIEVFSAPSFKEGASYNDMYLKSYNRSILAVYSNTPSYYAFLGGDNPLSVLTGTAGNGKKLVIMKESFGNAFAPWALNNYSEVYVIDIRKFNSAGKRFKIKEFYDFIKFDDLLIINYPVSVASSGIRTHLLNFAL